MPFTPMLNVNHSSSSDNSARYCFGDVVADSDPALFQETDLKYTFSDTVPDSYPFFKVTLKRLILLSKRGEYDET